MRVLIIEDNIELSHSMKTGLETMGFHVDISNTGLEGEEKAYVNGYDAVLLDLNLPDKDGLDILKFLRKSEVNVPVIIITARDEIEERAMGLPRHRLFRLCPCYSVLLVNLHCISRSRRNTYQIQLTHPRNYRRRHGLPSRRNPRQH